MDLFVHILFGGAVIRFNRLVNVWTPKIARTNRISLSLVLTAGWANGESCFSLAAQYFGSHSGWTPISAQIFFAMGDLGPGCVNHHIGFLRLVFCMCAFFSLQLVSLTYMSCTGAPEWMRSMH